ncbi:hypothetical protein [Arachidicoccus sp.]|jgi:hypothetical protein|uniref:hypothetical protein n=1 Tax=Arachidicoccus sp. TaxID=1872624 RepID=UPI003D23D294
MEAKAHNCLTCGKPLKGRIDKKFCDDYCRNSFNNRQNSDQNNLVRNLNNVLRKNRRILQEALEEEGMIKMPKDKLAQQGFNFKYHTHQYLNQKGQTYFFNYEFGYLFLENDWILIVKRSSNL